MEKMVSSLKSKSSEIEDPEGTSDEVGMSAVKIQDMQAKRYV